MWVRVLLATVAVMASGPATANTYTVDPERSQLVVRLFKEGIASGFAHNHVIRATELSGTIVADPAAPTDASVAITVQAAGLRADEPEARKQYGLTKPLKAEDREKIQTAMEDEDQLDIESFPEISFESTSVGEADDRGYTVTGLFTLHGTTREITVPVSAEIADGELRASGSFEFLQSDYGIEPYSAALGMVKNKDRAELIFEVVAKPVSEAREGDEERNEEGEQPPPE